MLRYLAVSTLTACGFSIAGSNTPPLDADRDALGGEPGMQMIDASDPIDAPTALSCHGSFEIVCLSTAPAQAFDVNGNATRTVNTDSDAACLAPAAGSTIMSACIVAATTVNINGALRATGSKPLILVGTTRISINGGSLVDVSSRGLERGAGARACPLGGGAGGNAGGHGGSFGTRGGSGGTGGTGSPGSPSPISAITALVGGCNGAPGGASAVVNAGAGGLGGGAVLLISPSVDVNGTINASGGGGGGGVAAAAGAGGGGSGGAIVIDSQNFAFNGGSFLYAQGGGGGEGASLTTAGSPGSAAPTPGGAASGGRNASSEGGNGGDGAVSSDGSPGNTGSDGGGGGGGGAGHIFTTDSNLNASGMAFPALRM